MEKRCIAGINLSGEKLCKLFRIMKLSFLILFVGIIQLSAGAYSQNTLLEITLVNADFKDLLTEIGEQSEFTFVYNVDDLETLAKIDCDFKAAKVHEILDHCFEQTQMSYEVRDKVIIITPKEPPVEITPKPVMRFFQQEQEGEVQGSIAEAATGELISYANVQLVGTTIGTISDEKGFYSLKRLEPGTYDLRVTFVGYSDSQATVKVSAGEVTKQDFRLSLTSIQGEEVVVTAMARGQAKAINTQIAARTIKNVVSEQKIRELPDANAAEALARLPGVSVERSGGEAVEIKVRGVSSNTMFVNGMRLDGGLASISSSMIGSIELNKAFMADHDADVLGGEVEFKMREAPPGFKKEIWVRSGYNGFTNSFKMQDVSVLLSNRFFKDRLGVMVSLNYDRKDRGRDVLSASYANREYSTTGSEDILNTYLDGIALSHNENMNNRYGATLYTDFRLKNGKLYYQTFFSQLNSETYNTSNSFSTGSSLKYASVYDRSLSRNFLQGIGGEHTLLGAKVEWSASMSNRTTETLDHMTYDAFGGKMTGGKSDIDSSTTINEFMDFASHNLEGTISNWLSRSSAEDYSGELAAKLDVELPFRLSNKIGGYLKFGGKVRDMKRGYDNFYGENSLYHGHGERGYLQVVRERLPDLGWIYTNAYVNHATFAAQPYEQDFSILGAKTYFFPDFNKVKTVLDNSEDLLIILMTQDVNDYTNSEKYYAGYLMSGIDIGKYITFLPGVRYERYDYITTAKYAIVEGYGVDYNNQGYITDTTAGNINAQFYPMMHLKIKPTKWFDIRLAATKTVTRPPFSMMSPRYYLSSVSFATSKGNPDLKPQTNYNYDLYLSFYTGKIGLFTIGAFYKKLTDQVLNYTVKIIDPEEWGLPEAYQNKDWSEPKNNQWPGYVRGLELDWQTHFSYLPRPFNGILLNMNLTYMQSETRYPFYSFRTSYIDEYPYKIFEGSHDSRVNKVIGMPDMVANVALGYELGGFAGRISAYYQGSTITTAQASNKSFDRDKAALLRLDMQFSQKFKKVPGLVFYLNVNNMTNNPDRMVLTYYPEKTVREERYGVSGDLGVRYKF
ncbi:MAG: TonB-dependent receptor [Bacteroidota bacterium]